MVIARRRRAWHWNWWRDGACRPDLILADYNLPNGMNGLAGAASLRQKLHSRVPVDHPDRRHLDRDVAQHRAPGLRAAQQAGEG